MARIEIFMRGTGLALLIASFAACSRPLEVEVVSPEEGPVEVSFREPARTRLPRPYLVTLPIDARIGRLELEPGDHVKENQPLVVVETYELERAVAEAEAEVAALEAELRVKRDVSLEDTVSEEAAAMVEAMKETLAAIDLEIEAERKRLENAEASKRRFEQLAEGRSVAPEERDAAFLAAATALIDVRKTELMRKAMEALQTAVRLGPRFVREYVARKRLEEAILQQQLLAARARLEVAAHRRGLARIVSPISGVVLERFEPGEGLYPAGTRLYRLGRLEELEVVANVLTEDALHLVSGTEVRLRAARDAEPRPGRVRRIEPQGFTKTSALGIEQQRVKVHVTLDEPAPAWGIAYRVTARFITASRDEALRLPRHALLEGTEGPQVQVLVEGKIELRPIEVGLRSDRHVEVLSGLGPRDRVVAHPDADTPAGRAARER